MTSGLRELAGDRLRSTLITFTRSPLSGAFTGAATTAILQSSSATTITAVGFVSAGLMTFPMALGIIFGANAGTTITGWIVTLLGFKLQLGTIALPLVLAGAILKLFAGTRLATAGLTLAGFSLIFIGISLLQSGMSGLPNLISPENLPALTPFGMLQLVAIGILVTIITQSSSAGVATTLAALFAGAINLEQAICFVIGMDVGTTFTAAVATIGGSTEARRTGFSHVIYNLFTGIFALLLVTPYVYALNKYAPEFLADNPGVALVAFHTGFNVLGVMLVLPFASQFARLIIHLFPERKSRLSQELDNRFLNQPEVALIKLQEVVNAIYIELLSKIAKLEQSHGKFNEGISQLDLVNEARIYADNIQLKHNEEKSLHTLIAILQGLDHLERLNRRCTEDAKRALVAYATPEIAPFLSGLVSLCMQLKENAGLPDQTLSVTNAQQFSNEINAFAPEYRIHVAQQVGLDEITSDEGRSRMEAIRWLRRISIHIYRISAHLASIEKQTGNKDQP